MARARLWSRFLIAACVIAGGAVFAGCAGTAAAGACCPPSLPPDLPADPEPRAKYCRVWVPPVYRDVPRLVQTCPPCHRQVPETVMETRYEEICVKPRETCVNLTPGTSCEQAVVQTRPGGWRWREQEPGCWKYCYEPPCYTWCNKVVEEEGIAYCTESPPEYRTVVRHEPVTRYRTEYEPGRYEIVYQKEVYRPGHWEWRATQECSDCACPSPCPTRPFVQQPCQPPARGGVTADCPRTN